MNSDDDYYGSYLGATFLGRSHYFKHTPENNAEGTLYDTPPDLNENGKPHFRERFIPYNMGPVVRRETEGPFKGHLQTKIPTDDDLKMFP